MKATRFLMPSLIASVVLIMLIGATNIPIHAVEPTGTQDMPIATSISAIQAIQQTIQTQTSQLSDVVTRKLSDAEAGLLAGSGVVTRTPPPLVSSAYLNANSLITGKSANGKPCEAPCFQDVTVGKTTFTDAVALIKANPLFSGLQSQDASSGNPPSATWNTAAGEACCQMTANDSGVVSAILIKYAPHSGLTAATVIKKFGTPQYVSGTDYSSTEVAVALIFPKAGLIVWVSPGDPTSTLAPDDPVVVVTCIDPLQFTDLLRTATLQGWNGYLSYQTYRTATPIITPVIMVTPQG